jgi:tetratricopeptide (TPR) repeat protein
VKNLAAVLEYKGPRGEAQAAGRHLGVDTILTGTLQRQGERLLISAHLTDVATGRPVWTMKYDRRAAELQDVQDDIATAMTADNGLRLRATKDERRKLVRHPTTDGDAYDLYLQARYLQRRAREEDYLYSRELLQRAVVRDPGFALAYAALSGNYAMTVTDGLERPTDAWPQVNRYIRQALDIDPELPEAHAFTHAVAFLFDWDWAGAERARQRLLQYPVGDFDPHVLRALAIEHWALGRPEEALKLARRTRELDPLSVYLAILEADYLLRTGQLDAAVALYEHAIRNDPTNANAYFGLSEARYGQRRFDDAIEARRQAHEAAGDDALRALFATARGEQGYREIERAWVKLQLGALKARQATGYVSPLDFARAHAQLGEKDLAFKYLTAAFDDRSPGLVFLKVDRVWDAVRDDPRFHEAVRKVGLP